MPYPVRPRSPTADPAFGKWRRDCAGGYHRALVVHRGFLSTRGLGEPVVNMFARKRLFLVKVSFVAIVTSCTAR